MKYQLHLPAVQAIQACIIVVLCVELPPPDPAPPIVDDLAIADPQKNITCLGGHSLAGWNLGPVPFLAKTIQELCAHPFYGGNGVSGPNLRGYCHDGDVFFGLDNERFLPSRDASILWDQSEPVVFDASEAVKFGSLCETSWSAETDASATTASKIPPNSHDRSL